MHVTFAGALAAAREVNGQELPVGAAAVANGALTTSFTANQPRTFALRLNAGANRVAPVRSQPVTLSYNLAAATNDDTKSTTGFDGKGNALPAEMLPATVNFNGVAFKLGPADAGANNAVIAKGQTISLPAGSYNRVYILAASADGDQTAAFRVGGQTASLNIENWGGKIGQWDARIWKGNPYTEKDWAVSANHAAWDPDPAKQQDRSQAKRSWSPRYPEDFAGIRARLHQARRRSLVRLASSHARGLNQPYEYSYLFAYAIDMPAGARTSRCPITTKSA